MHKKENKCFIENIILNIIYVCQFWNNRIKIKRIWIIFYDNLRKYIEIKILSDISNYIDSI